ncbi:hypothetical protein ACNHUS_35175 [Actinomycetes bacterium M1A6_2h]
MLVTISFDPDVDRPNDVALQLAWSYGFNTVDELLAGDEDEEFEEEGDTPPDLEGWTASKMRKYVTQLKPTARKVLRAIADQAPEATVESVQSSTGLEPSSFAGSMSSFGFAVKNTRGVRVKPFSKNGHLYSMTVPIADLVLETLDEAGF